MPFDIEERDVIVVGSGPGGATVAKELAQGGKRVLILEWGDNKPLKGSFWQGSRAINMPGKSLLFTPQGLGLVRGITTGGSTVFNYGTSFPVPFEMLESYGIDIRDEVEEIKKELPVSPLKDEMVGPMAKRLMESARDLGYKWKKFNKFMYQDKWKPEYAFSHYGDPHEVKWSARMYVDQAVATGTTLVNGARVAKVILDGQKAIGVAFRKERRQYKVFAPRIILSAGGIGTPVILRASGIKSAGYDYFFDPLMGVRGTVKDIDVPGSEIPMTAGVHIEDEGYMLTDMAHPFVTSALFAAWTFRFHKMLSRRRTLQIMVKAKDELGGKLTDRGGVRKRLGRNEKQKLNKGFQRARKILENAGARDIFKTPYLAAHPGGTVKVGDLVDANLMTAYENLFVCDCSVIPEAWGLPPTTTIIGLGKRLAKHLLKEGK
ncbi:MAG: GMC family oxidoreductase [Desulfobacterales bacterium]|nr:GMC family oxidoreductase [Desulfobacterales bacterium]